MGGKRLRGVRVGPLEHDPVTGKRIDGGRLDSVIPVNWQMIGSQRVDREEDDRSVDRRRGAGVPPSSDRGQNRCQRGQREDEREAKRSGHLDPA